MVYKTASTTLPEDKLKELKKKTGESTNKECLAKAIYHYLSCPYVEDVQWEEWRKEPTEKNKRGRKPSYLEKYFKEKNNE
ncbi:MAG: DUF5371 family protein [Archaeoglobaceae archaeon]